MTIDTQTITKIARLARIKVPPEEQQQLTGELNKILSWIAQLDEVDVKGVEPLYSVNDMALRRRDDVVSDGNKAADILSNAPARTADFFTVPKVVE